MSGVDEAIGRRLRALRERHGLSQSNCASMLYQRGFRTSPNTVHAIETGRRAMRLSEAFALCYALDLDVTALTDDLRPGIRSSMAPAIRVLEEYDRTGRVQ